MSDEVLRLPAVCKRLGLSKSSIYYGIKHGGFPKPIRIGMRAIGWPKSWIDAWLESRTQSDFSGKSFN